MPQPAHPDDLPMHQQPPSEVRWWRVSHIWYIQAPSSYEAATAAQQAAPDQIDYELLPTCDHHSRQPPAE